MGEIYCPNVHLILKNFFFFSIVYNTGLLLCVMKYSMIVLKAFFYGVFQCIINCKVYIPKNMQRVIYFLEYRDSKILIYCELIPLLRIVYFCIPFYDPGDFHVTYCTL
uniref:Uncharacterized protein n=1 Tax=Anguilla anguilla TaxID=7936 RepID=A0A0E9WJI3_ANGAN